MQPSAPSASELVTLERTDHAVYVTLNRAEAANALSKGLVSALGEAFKVLSDEVRGAAGAALRAVVITGAGDKAFCAGADLKERRGMTLEQTWVFLDQLNAVFNAIAAFPRPVVAAINGVALGGGLELALACDIRVAVESAELGLPEVRIGIIPGAGGTQRLARTIGVAGAKELILTGRRVKGARAYMMGLVSEIVPAGALAEAAARVVAEISTAGPLALAAAKRAIDGGVGIPFADGLALEAACYEEVLASDDRNEGLAAFGEKRPPVFKGR
jgi:enoyl-CoA hydratase/carnithine racemase